MQDTTLMALDQNLQFNIQDKERLESIVAEIDIIDPAMSIAYGASTMSAIAQFSDSMLAQVKSKDAGFVGDQLTDLLLKVKGVDLAVFETQEEHFLARVPLIGTLFKKAERTITQYQTLTTQIDTISNNLEQSMVKLLRDIETLEQLFLRNREFYNDISMYIFAGREKIKLINANELPTAQQHAKQSNDAMTAQAVRDLMDRIQRFERRLHDLELSRTIAAQTAPQIRLIQSNNQTLAEKIQSSILSTIPIWKSQMVLALSINTQRNAARLQKDVADTTNALLRKNAEMLQQGSIETAHEVERSIIDIDTLREVQTRLLTTIEETVNIATEARERRVSIEKELGEMEHELRDRLTAIAANNKNVKVF